jgi:hypothetical protein
MRKLSVILFSLLAAVFISALSVCAQSPVAYVVEKSGVWVLNGDSPVTPGQKLPAGGLIRRRSSSSEDHITISDMQMEVLRSASRNCATDNCSRAITLPRPPPSRSFVKSLWDAAMETIFGSPHRSDSNLSRSGGLAEGVVEYKDGKVSLRGVLTPEGEQYLRWRAVTFARSGEWNLPVNLGKDATVSGLGPGLYEINLMRSNGSNFEPVGSSWILVALPADYEKASAAFNEVREIGDKWGDRVRPETRRLFLQASLENLTEKTPK